MDPQESPIIAFGVDISRLVLGIGKETDTLQFGLEMEPPAASRLFGAVKGLPEFENTSWFDRYTWGGRM
jgi:hypothetical protein